MSGHSRREFLASTTVVAVGAGAGPLTWPALGRATIPPMPSGGGDEPVRIGVIGTGGMGTGHVDAFLSIAKDHRVNVTIAALADVCQARLEVAKQKVEAAQGVGPHDRAATRSWSPVLEWSIP